MKLHGMCCYLVLAGPGAYVLPRQFSVIGSWLLSSNSSSEYDKAESIEK